MNWFFYRLRGAAAVRRYPLESRRWGSGSSGWAWRGMSRVSSTTAGTTSSSSGTAARRQAAINGLNRLDQQTSLWFVSICFFVFFPVTSQRRTWRRLGSLTQHTNTYYWRVSSSNSNNCVSWLIQIHSSKSAERQTVSSQKKDKTWKSFSHVLYVCCFKVTLFNKYLCLSHRGKHFGEWKDAGVNPNSGSDADFLIPLARICTLFSFFSWEFSPQKHGKHRLKKKAFEGSQSFVNLLLVCFFNIALKEFVFVSRLLSFMSNTHQV